MTKSSNIRLLRLCIEILWTGFHSLLLGDGALTAKTYLWMFPIYGAAAFASPLFLAVRKSCPLWQRLGLYSVTIFLVEFAAGGLIVWQQAFAPGIMGTIPFPFWG